MINFLCQKCGYSRNVATKFSGKRVKCPKCNNAATLPCYSDRPKPSCPPVLEPTSKNDQQQIVFSLTTFTLSLASTCLVTSLLTGTAFWFFSDKSLDGKEPEKALTLAATPLNELNGDAPDSQNMPLRTSDNDRRESEAIQAVLKELRKLGSVAAAGINYRNYSSRVLDAKAEVDHHMAGISDDQIRESLQKSMEAYVDCSNYWNKAIQPGASAMLTEAEEKQFSRYFSKKQIIAVDAAVPLFWSYATEYRKDAEQLIAEL